MSERYRTLTTPTFERDFKRLDRQLASRIAKKIDWLAAHPEALSNPLRNMPPDLAGLQKYRVGDYRLLLWVDHSQRSLTLYAVEHRSSIYRSL